MFCRVFLAHMLTNVKKKINYLNHSFSQVIKPKLYMKTKQKNQKQVLARVWYTVYVYQVYFTFNHQ